MKMKRIATTLSLTAALLGLTATAASAYSIGQTVTYCPTEGCTRYQVTSIGPDSDPRGCRDRRTVTLTKIGPVAGGTNTAAKYRYETQIISFGC